MAKSWLHQIHHFMLDAGKQVSALWIFFVALIIWVSFPVAILLASFLGAIEIASWFDGGKPLLFVFAIIIAIVLAVYVWHPYVRPAADRAAQALLEGP